jgi:recombination protein RecT
MAVSPSNQLVSIDEAILPVRRLLAANMTGIGAALGNYMAPERFLSAVVTLCRNNPDLADPRKANPSSLLLSVLRIAHLQLSPDPALGQAWIIPRKGKAEFQLGYKGALALSYRSPLVAGVRYGVVGPDDHFVWRDGRSWVLEHEPTEDGWPDNLDDVRAAWTIIELRSGSMLPRVMYRQEIIRHKDRGSYGEVWRTDPAAMSVKTVIGDACRRGPFEGEIGRAFMLDHSGEIGRGQPTTTEDERSIIDLQPEEGGAGAKPSDKFKAAHRQPKQPEPVCSRCGKSYGGEDDCVCPPLDIETAEDDRPLDIPEAVDCPTLLSRAKCDNLRRLAAEAGDTECSGLISKAAELSGSGTLEQVPAVYESDLLKWIDNLNPRRSKR